ncbi:hypothetical protein T484DRAFT_1911030, partial [Baffinella frigidus]
MLHQARSEDGSLCLHDLQAAKETWDFAIRVGRQKKEEDAVRAKEVLEREEEAAAANKVVEREARRRGAEARAVAWRQEAEARDLAWRQHQAISQELGARPAGIARPSGERVRGPQASTTKRPQTTLAERGGSSRPQANVEKQGAKGAHGMTSNAPQMGFTLLRRPGTEPEGRGILGGEPEGVLGSGPAVSSGREMLSGPAVLSGPILSGPAILGSGAALSASAKMEPSPTEQEQRIKLAREAYRIDV